MIYVESLFTPFFEILEVDLALFAALIGQSTSNHKIDVKSDTSKNNMSDLMFPPHANHHNSESAAAFGTWFGRFRSNLQCSRMSIVRFAHGPEISMGHTN